VVKPAKLQFCKLSGAVEAEAEPLRLGDLQRRTPRAAASGGCQVLTHNVRGLVTGALSFQLEGSVIVLGIAMGGGRWTL